MITLCAFFSSHVSLELGEEVKQMIVRHGPLLKSRQSTSSVSMPLSRQTSLSGQVRQFTSTIHILNTLKMSMK